MDEIDERAQLIAKTSDNKLRTVETDESMEEVLRTAEKDGRKMPHFDERELIKSTYHFIQTQKWLKENVEEW